MGRIGEFVLFFVVTIIATFVLRLLVLNGFFIHVVNHSPGPCKIIQGTGSEDLALLPDGLVFVSSGLRYQMTFSYNKELDKRVSKLLTFDFKKPDQDPVELTLKNFNRTGFNPHGISVYRDPSSGAVSLFVVNHRPDAEAIEIFDFERETHSLIHRRSVVDQMIWSPNNLYAVDTPGAGSTEGLFLQLDENSPETLGPDSFYVTNWNFFHSHNKILSILQLYFLHDVLHGNIVFFDGFKGIEAVGGITPNGISMDKDKRFVFASTSLGRSVAVFRRSQDNTLEISQDIKVGSYVDNINVDPVTGNLWLATIPRVMDGAKHANNLSHPCPSQVLTVKLGEPSTSGIAFPENEVREVYMNDGQEFSFSTAATVYKNHLLIGSLDNNMLYCEIKFY